MAAKRGLTPKEMRSFHKKVETLNWRQIVNLAEQLDIARSLGIEQVFEAAISAAEGVGVEPCRPVNDRMLKHLVEENGTYYLPRNKKFGKEQYEDAGQAACCAAVALRIAHLLSQSDYRLLTDPWREVMGEEMCPTEWPGLSDHEYV